MRYLLMFICCLLMSSPAAAVTAHGVDLAETTTLSGEILQLNGYGLRKKMFFKIYIGSLYTAEKATTAEQVLSLPGAKIIRMDFLYKKVGRDKIVDAFAEGFAKNSPQLQGHPSLKEFLELFTADFVAGDQVDLILNDNSVSALHNGNNLGTISEPQLSRAVLLIYLGKQPADEKMKQGMLGSNR